MSAVAAARTLCRKSKLSIRGEGAQLPHRKLILSFHAMTICRDADPVNQVATGLEGWERKSERLWIIGQWRRRHRVEFLLFLFVGDIQRTEPGFDRFRKSN